MRQSFEYKHTPYTGEFTKPELVAYINRQFNDIGLALTNINLKLNELIEKQSVKVSLDYHGNARK